MISHGRGVDVDVRSSLGGPDPFATFSFRSDSYVIAAGTATLPDRSGNGLDATQGTAGLQPSWSANGFGTNSRAYILVDAVDDFLSIPDNALLEPGAGSFLYIAALRLVSGAAFRCVVGKGSDSANSGQRIFFEGGGLLHTYANGATNYAAAAFGVANGADRIVVWGLDSESSESIYATNSDAIARAAVVITAATNTANPMKIGQDNTPAYQCNMRLAGLEFFNLGVGASISNDRLNTLINQWKLYYGI